MRHTTSAFWARVAVRVAVATVMSLHGSAMARPSQPPLPEGEALFASRCAACHTIGGGRRVGPDLQGVTMRRDRDWLRRWISAPEQLIAAGDPTAVGLLAEYGTPMPNMGLTAAEVDAVLAYLESQVAAATASAGQTAGSASAAPPAPSRLDRPAPLGDARVGKQLFTGERRFASGGPPCMACHSVAGLGALGGGALGPDLTQAFARFGEEGLRSIVSSFPFPTMNPIFVNRPLTEQEQADLIAFLQEASAGGRSPQVAGRLVLLGAMGAVTLAGASHLVWRRRLTGVRRQLVARGAPRAFGSDRAAVKDAR